MTLLFVLDEVPGNAVSSTVLGWRLCLGLFGGALFFLFTVVFVSVTLLFILDEVPGKFVAESFIGDFIGDFFVDLGLFFAVVRPEQLDSFIYYIRFILFYYFSLI